MNPIGTGILPIPKEGANQSKNQIVENPIVHERQPIFTRNNIIISAFAIIMVFFILFFIGRRGRKKGVSKEWTEEFKKVQENLLKNEEQKTKTF